MTRKLSFSDEALDDLTSIAEYIAVESASLDVARAVVSRLTERSERLANLPGVLGTARPELAADLRSTPEGRYILFFRYEGDLLEIAAVVHGSIDLAARFLSSDPR